MKKIISAKVMSIVFAFVRFSSASRLKDIAQSDYFDWFKCLFVRSFSSTVGVAVRLLRRLAVKIQISSTCVGGSNPPENTPNSAIQRTYIHEKKRRKISFLFATITLRYVPIKSPSSLTRRKKSILRLIKIVLH